MWPRGLLQLPPAAVRRVDLGGALRTCRRSACYRRPALPTRTRPLCGSLAVLLRIIARACVPRIRPRCVCGSDRGGAGGQSRGQAMAPTRRGRTGRSLPTQRGAAASCRVSHTGMAAAEWRGRLDARRHERGGARRGGARLAVRVRADGVASTPPLLPRAAMAMAGDGQPERAREGRQPPSRGGRAEGWPVGGRPSACVQCVRHERLVVRVAAAERRPDGRRRSHGRRQRRTPACPPNSATWPAQKRPLQGGADRSDTLV